MQIIFLSPGENILPFWLNSQNQIRENKTTRTSIFTFLTEIHSPDY